MAGRKNIAYTKQEEPEFIKRFKEKIGYQEPETLGIEAKRPISDLDGSGEDSGSESEENKPQVVVLKKGDLTVEEAEEYLSKEPSKQNGSDNGVSDVASERIMFKKPEKRALAETDAGLVYSSNKRTKVQEHSATQESDATKAKQEKSKKLKNIKLLSFNADDGDDADDG